MTLVGEILTTPFGVSNESRQFLLPLLALLFVSIICISVASYFLIGSVVSPVEYLLEIANQAVQGRGFDDPDPIQQRDELGKLYEAFIAITGRLQCFDVILEPPRDGNKRLIQLSQFIALLDRIGGVVTTSLHSLVCNLQQVFYRANNTADEEI